MARLVAVGDTGGEGTGEGNSGRCDQPAWGTHEKRGREVEEGRG